MERFWDARAREDALHFVDSRRAIGAPEDDAFWAGGQEALERLLTAVGVDVAPGSVVADIGCGVGRLTRPLAVAAERVLAIDVSREMLARAQRLNAHLDNVEWLHGDGRTLRPIPDGSVDACVSHVVFRHVPDPAIALGYIAEIGRVLRPGGVAAIELSNDPAAHGRHRPGPRRPIAALLGRASRGAADPAWLGSSVDLDELRGVATHAGLVVTRVAGAGTQFCGVGLRKAEIPAGEARRTDAVGSFYDEYWTRPRHYAPEPELRAAILGAVRPGDTVLDVGCGACNSYAAWIRDRAGSYVGVDVSATAVHLARDAGFDARVVEDAAALPFPDASFDAVLCVEVLEHLLRPDAAASEILRVLRPGGRLVACTPNVAYWRLRLFLLHGTWNPHGDDRAIEEPWRDPHVRFFTPSTLARMLRSAGFTAVDASAHGGRFRDHVSTRPTAYGRGRLYPLLERGAPSLLGAVVLVTAERRQRPR